MKKVMIIASVGCFFGFLYNDIKLLRSMGYEVHCAGNFKYETTEKTKEFFKEQKIIVHQIDFERNPFSKATICAYCQLKQLFDKEEFGLTHCHTPVGGVVARLVANKYRKQGMKVLYTAHGFHFFKGAPLKNWLIYYPVEKWMSRYTDVLITINKEDYKRAKEKFHAKKTVYVPGVGVDTEKFKIRNNGRKKIRDEIGLADYQIMLLSVGELNENKNHEAVIRAIQGMDLVYVIVGKGELKEKLERIAKDCEVNLYLTGFRSDVADFYHAADIYVLPSLREGLNVSLMEAMASGLPCIVSCIRGNTDLIDDRGGLLFKTSSLDDIKSQLKLLLSDQKMLNGYGMHNQEKIKLFSCERVRTMMQQLYDI